MKHRMKCNTILSIEILKNERYTNLNTKFQLKISISLVYYWFRE